MDNAGVQENRHDESEPLVGLVLKVAERLCGTSWVHRILAVWHAKSAELGKSAIRVEVRGGVGTWPFDRTATIPILYTVDRVHTRYKPSAHIDENIWRGSDHRIKVGLNFDGGPGQDS